ncbi:MAG: rRNA pseudouridine synthase [Propionibacteriaceae bacterium]|jgi:23S rRNA pseudouridine2605 synthase|nr:rRNA pseudouridine synthase [Propionibacteriaceae bacterium]
MSEMRLQKALAAAGVASRRASEEMIAEGRVEVNGEPVLEMGRKVDPATDVIRVDGKRIPPANEHVYFALNKPTGVESTMAEEPAPTLLDFTAGLPRVFHVGRLDRDTSGLLLLTNDGDFAQRVTHPSYELDKEYLAEVRGEVDPKTVKRLLRGIQLDDGPVKPDKVQVMQAGPKRSLVKVVLHEGRNRIVRRMFEAVGHPVVKLSRLRIGPVKLGSLKSGKLRELTREELGALFDSLGM